MTLNQLNVVSQIEEPIIKSNPNKKDCRLELVHHGDVVLYHFSIGDGEKFVPNPVVIEWKVPAINVKGVWKNAADFSKRIQADWELENMESRISMNAPILSLFGNQDENILTFACSNATNRIELGAKYREEDNALYCQLILFTECRYAIDGFEIDLRLDYRDLHFSESVTDMASWWETYDMEPMTVPAIARQPLYSTWYQYHQDLKEASLLEECREAKRLGFDAVIIDDGWQTIDSNRGYDFTGDWVPERIANMKHFVSRLQAEGMKVGLWFSVPFCGKKSKAYQRFKGKFLTENHRWAPVFDPRYPVVREYLVSIYTAAVRDWGLDGLKLDFIDDFRSYPETSFDEDPERDFYSINEAVASMLLQIKEEVQALNPDVFIEFRQLYVGPAIRKFGNMLRAFDCPGDYTMNRVRIADIKMLCGNTAVHSDMVTWHVDEPVAYAALQIVNTLFSVPQLSVFVNEISEEHKKMVRFFMEYWKENREVFLAGKFTPYAPLANYPVKKVQRDGRAIFGVYDNQSIPLKESYDEIHLINGKLSQYLVLHSEFELGNYEFEVLDCQGVVVERNFSILKGGVTSLNVPSCGLVKMKLINM